MIMMRRIARFVSLVCIGAPTAASAHEVYVLDGATIAQALAAPSPNPFSAYHGNEYEFYFWAFVSFVVISTVLCAAAFRVFEKTLTPLFYRLKPLAHSLVRLTVGVCLISFGLYGALFGPELPFSALFGAATGMAQAAFVFSGALIILGIAARSIALILLALYAYAYSVFGVYVLTYTDHLGAFLLLLILGSGPWSLGEKYNLLRMPLGLRALLHRCSHLAFPLLRILFGFGVMFAAVYAKFIHSELALQVVIQHDLTRYFPFEPLFVVLGALIIEFLAGLMVFTGVAVRWTGLFLIFWLTLSLLYFQEAVWPHIVLFGLGLAIFCHGYDRYSLEGAFLKRRGREPVL